MKKYIIKKHGDYWGVWANEEGWRKCNPIELFNTKYQAQKWAKEN